MLAGYPVDLVVYDGGQELALVDDPAGNPDGRSLRKVLARLDVVAVHAAVKRIPAWRCLAEPEQVAVELAEELKIRAS